MKFFRITVDATHEKYRPDTSVHYVTAQSSEQAVEHVQNKMIKAGWNPTIKTVEFCCADDLIGTALIEQIAETMTDKAYEQNHLLRTYEDLCEKDRDGAYYYSERANEIDTVLEGMRLALTLLGYEVSQHGNDFTIRPIDF